MLLEYTNTEDAAVPATKYNFKRKSYISDTSNTETGVQTKYNFKRKSYGSPSVPVSQKPEPEPKPESIPDYGGDINNPSKIVISKQMNNLRLYDSEGRVIYEFPVALGKKFGNKQWVGDMKTPEGNFSVQSIENAAHWTHDFKDGKGVIQGAYGPYFIRLNTPGFSGIGIHGTHDPNSIGTRVSEGCVRLRNEDLEKLKPLVSKGMSVVIESSDWDSPWKAKPIKSTQVPVNMRGNINIGHMGAIVDILDKYGIRYRISSGYRPNSSNPKSWHIVGHGLDIAAPVGMSNDDFLKQFVGNRELLNAFKSIGYGILNEYIPEVRKRTKATGPHLHIGPDDWARENHSVFYDKNMKLYNMW